MWLLQTSRIDNLWIKKRGTEMKKKLHDERLENKEKNREWLKRKKSGQDHRAITQERKKSFWIFLSLVGRRIERVESPHIEIGIGCFESHALSSLLKIEMFFNKNHLITALPAYKSRKSCANRANSFQLLEWCESVETFFRKIPVLQNASQNFSGGSNDVSRFFQRWQSDCR